MRTALAPITFDQLNAIAQRLVDQEGRNRTIFALTVLARSFRRKHTKYPWNDTPIGKGFDMPAIGKPRDTMVRATSLAAQRGRAHNERWTCRTVHEGGKPVIRVRRLA